MQLRLGASGAVSSGFRIVRVRPLLARGPAREVRVFAKKGGDDEEDKKK